MNKLYHIVYKIRDPSTGYYYIGKHSTNNIEDNYMGSGTWIKILSESEPLSRCEKYIIHICDTSDEAYKKEELEIGDLWKTDSLCKNSKPGGKVSAFEKHIYSAISMQIFGYEHHMKSPEFLEQFKKNNLEKHGYEFPFQDDTVQSKGKLTCSNRHGGIGSGSDSIKNKVQNTNIQLYGDKHTLKLSHVKEARDDANIKKYGNKNPFTNNKKLQEVLMERYAVTNMMLIPDVKSKHKKIMASKDWSDRDGKNKTTNMKRYGIAVYMNLPEIQNKHKRKCPFNCNNKIYNAGNFSNHMIKVHNWSKDKIKIYKKDNMNEN